MSSELNGIPTEIDNDLQSIFGLSSASFLTLPRVLIEAMPDKWQNKMADLWDELDQTFPNQPDLWTRVQITRHGRIIKTPEWIINYRHPDREVLDAMRNKA